MSDIDILMKAYVGEVQARFRYKLYAEKAQSEGFEQIASIFVKTLEQETEHAEIFFDLILKYSDSINILVNAEYPVFESNSTLQNLKSASGSEHEEWTKLYLQFANEAENQDVKNAFLHILEIEKNHEKRFNKLIYNIEHNQVFNKVCHNTTWECRNCGHIHIGKSALDICTTCGFPKSFSEVESDNY